jgi:hypothetical protein
MSNYNEWCGADNQCTTNSCNTGSSKCNQSPPGGACAVAADCTNADCNGTTCNLSNAGEACSAANQCTTNSCNGTTCNSSANGGACAVDSDCGAGNTCTGGLCCKALAANTGSGDLNCGQTCFVAAGPVNGWQVSSNDGRSISVNGNSVAAAAVPLPGSAPYRFVFGVPGTCTSWYSWSWW